MSIDLRRRRVQWGVILLAWVACGLLMLSQTYLGYARAGHPIDLGYALLLVAPYILLWVLLTPLVIRLARRFPLERRCWRSSLTFHAAAGLLIAVGQNILSNIIAQMVKKGEAIEISWSSVWQTLLTMFDYGVLLYWIIVLLHEAYASYQRLRERELTSSRLETQLAEARLQALRMQLQPHFLFNTLHSISELIHLDIEAADTMIARLGDFLRLTLENSGAQLVSLQSEMDALRCYVAIEQTRFRGRLALQLEVDEHVQDALVPSFLWQPIVENAVRHGLATSHREGRITIRARQREGMLQLQVEDNGAGLAAQDQEVPHFREGIGLSNTRAVLQHMYGADQSFTLANADAGGVVATLEIPLTITHDVDRGHD